MPRSGRTTNSAEGCSSWCFEAEVPRTVVSGLSPQVTPSICFTSFVPKVERHCGACIRMITVLPQGVGISSDKASSAHLLDGCQRPKHNLSEVLIAALGFLVHSGVQTVARRNQLVESMFDPLCALSACVMGDQG